MDVVKYLHEFEQFKDKEFIYFKNSLKRLGIQGSRKIKKNDFREQIKEMATLVREYLIAKKFNINEKDKNGCTVFFKACEQGEIEKISFLISLGVDIREKNNVNS